MERRNSNSGKLILITGGAASGKSGYAEALAVSMNTAPMKQTLWYLATMHFDTEDPETIQCIEKHRKARAGKGFRTLEQERDLVGLSDTFRKGDIILLEDLPNLLANEMFSPLTSADPKEMIDTNSEEALFAFLERKILYPIREWLEKGICILIVGSRIAEDLPQYRRDGEESVEAYKKGLSYLQRELGKSAAMVTEVVCGIPLRCK